MKKQLALLTVSLMATLAWGHLYQQMHSNQKVREAVRREQLSEYVKRKGLAVRYYQDYGWPVVELDRF